MPYKSDWVIAVGTFNGNADPGNMANSSVCTTLPVELTEFSVISDESDIHLYWVTASEENNAGFEVHLSSSGSNFFQTIDYVEGAGTTTKERRYKLTLHNMASGNYTFRLKQIDFDGSFDYSTSINLLHTLSAAYKIEKPYPSPFRANASIQFSVAKSQNIVAELYDISGRKIRTVYNETVGANSTQEISVYADTLPNGIYFVQIMGETFKATERLVLAR